MKSQQDSYWQLETFSELNNCRFYASTRFFLVLVGLIQNQALEFIRAAPENILQVAPYELYLHVFTVLSTVKQWSVFGL